LRLRGLQDYKAKDSKGYVYKVSARHGPVTLLPERESFALLVICAFQNEDALLACNILQWVCSMDRHTPVSIHTI
jgi:hypothetical protein